jgi:hypothetical protein
VTLVSELRELTGRYGSELAEAWNNSLAALGQVTRALSFGRRGYLSLEYQRPASSSWCDVVLLGAHDRAPSADRLELRHSATLGDQSGDLT